MYVLGPGRRLDEPVVDPGPGALPALLPDPVIPSEQPEFPGPLLVVGLVFLGAGHDPDELAGHPLVPQGQQQFADPPLWLVEVCGVPDLLGVGGVGFLVLALALETVLAQGLQVLWVGDSAPLGRNHQVDFKDYAVLLRGPAALEADARRQSLCTALEA